jgi:hypothetical protein
MAATHQQIARALNAHHAKTYAGFYLHGLGGGRAIRARVHRGRLQVMFLADAPAWTDAPAGLPVADHVGRPVFAAGSQIVTPEARA